MSSTKPYLLRAIFDWAEDNAFTPQVLVDAEQEGVEVPRNYVVDGQIVLNISSGAVQIQVMDNERLSFSARFSGVEQNINLPIASIMAIFARENSQGIFFEEVDDDETDPDQAMLSEVPRKPSSKKSNSSDRKPPNLKIIK